MASRKYTLGRRAAKQAETRARIVEAAMRLHEERGPRETTISAVAERAGVQRLTVYRHFPSDHELFTACTSTWLERNPPPDLRAGNGDEPIARIRPALEALYRYYRRTADMWNAAYRDVDQVPALAGPMAEFEHYLDAARRSLLDELAPAKRARRRASAAVGHALDFSTWRSLSEQGLGDRAMAALVTDWIGAALKPPS